VSLQTQSRAKLRELLELIREIDERRFGPEWGIQTEADLADGHRALMHMLQLALFSHFEADPERPRFRRIVSPTRKIRGDNPDAIYFEAPVRGDREYVLRGNTAGAVYTSFTVEEGEGEGHYATGTASGLYDAQFDIDDDGNYEILVSPKPRPRNWLELSPRAARITTRHYFEEERYGAADPERPIPLSIEPVIDPGPPPTWNDARVAAATQRLINNLRSETLLQPPRKPSEQPSWVSSVPNQFPKPEKPGDMAFAAMDIAYSMAPYLLGPDQALVMTGRFPRCRFANVCLWNRYLQTYDYAHRRVALNRVQTRLEPDGSFRMLLAHEDPGLPNWIDTEGRPFGMVYWRFLLPEGEIETPRAEVVPFASISRARETGRAGR